MVRRPRGVCPGCGRVRQVCADGTIGAHRLLTRQGRNTGFPCPGVDREPVSETSDEQKAGGDE